MHVAPEHRRQRYAAQRAPEGLVFAVVLALLNGAPYGILRAADNTPLMGRLLLFGALGAVVVATRRMDWSAAGERLYIKPPRHSATNGWLPVPPRQHP